MSSIKKRSLVDQIYERLRSDIISLELPLGSRVNVNELQESLGVSCTPIREAINRLQQEGLIVYENNVGARVLTLDATDVEEITQLATTLHCAAARLAMARTDHQVLAQELEQCIAAFETAQTPRQQSEVQGQQLLLRNLYAAHGMDVPALAGDFRAIRRGVEENRPEAVCEALDTSAQRVRQAVCEHLR